MNFQYSSELHFYLLIYEMQYQWESQLIKWLDSEFSELIPSQFIPVLFDCVDSDCFPLDSFVLIGCDRSSIDIIGNDSYIEYKTNVCLYVGISWLSVVSFSPELALALLQLSNNLSTFWPTYRLSIKWALLKLLKLWVIELKNDNTFRHSSLLLDWFSSLITLLNVNSLLCPPYYESQ